jgi:hypothetical protein
MGTSRGLATSAKGSSHRGQREPLPVPIERGTKDTAVELRISYTAGKQKIKGKQKHHRIKDWPLAVALVAICMVAIVMILVTMSPEAVLAVLGPLLHVLGE